MLEFTLKYDSDIQRYRLGYIGALDMEIPVLFVYKIPDRIAFSKCPEKVRPGRKSDHFSGQVTLFRYIVLSVPPIM